MLASALVAYLLVPIALAAFPVLEQADVDLPAGLQILGNQSSNNGIVGQQSSLNLFGRQNCPAGYNNCAYTGECCPLNAGNTCCGQFCIGLQPAGTACCPGYMCPPSWKCCGQTNGCYPEGGQCCTSAGQYCPPQWGCCGNRGYCYPTQDFQCCSNDGTFCPKNTKCVYCRGSTTRICCLGANDAEIPVFQTAPSNNGAGNNLNIPNPSTIQADVPSANPTTTTTTSAGRTTSAAAVQSYYTTTFYYTYIYWTRIVSVVTSTMTTETTTFSVLATDSFDASSTFRRMASSIESSASSSAERARPTAVVASPTTVRETVTQAAGGGSSAACGFRIDSMLAVAVALVACFLVR